MRDALRFGNRLIMMHEGRVVVDVEGEKEEKLNCPIAASNVRESKRFRNSLIRKHSLLHRLNKRFSSAFNATPPFREALLLLKEMILNPFEGVLLAVSLIKFFSNFLRRFRPHKLIYRHE